MRCDIPFTVRATTAADEAFIRDLYLGWLADRLGLDSFPMAMRNSLLDMQWRGHALSLKGSRPNAESSIVEAAKACVGWTLVDRAADAIHLVEIHVAPSWRGRGLGRTLIAALQGEAAETGRAVTLCVHPDNLKARALYDRMGFVAEEDVESPSPFASPVVIVRLRWTPP
jgi:ribosomal protein S18 acetylase RimI-like enzyme